MSDDDHGPLMQTITLPYSEFRYLHGLVRDGLTKVRATLEHLELLESSMPQYPTAKDEIVEPKLDGFSISRDGITALIQVYRDQERAGVAILKAEDARKAEYRRR